MGRFNVPIHCANCNRYINTISYFAEERREEPKRLCRRCQSILDKQARSGPPENKAALFSKSFQELRDIAEELGLEVEGTGVMGRLKKEDLLGALEDYTFAEEE